MYALHQSLKNITSGSPSLEDRFKAHRDASRQFKQFVTDLGLGQVRSEDQYEATQLDTRPRQIPLSPEASANGMTAVKVSVSYTFNPDRVLMTRTQFPPGIKAPDLLPKLLS